MYSQFIYMKIHLQIMYVTMLRLYYQTHTLELSLKWGSWCFPHIPLWILWCGSSLF